MRMKIFQHLRPCRVPTFVLAGLLVLMVPGLLSCEKQTFHFAVDVGYDEVWEIDATGDFETNPVVVTSNDIRGALDIPENGRITGVDIKALSLTIAKEGDNTATAVTLNGQIDDNVGSLDYVFSDTTVPLVGLDVPFIGLNALVESGITKLRNRIRAYIDQTNTADFELWLEGSPTPADSRVHLTAHLVVDITVLYDECLDVPTGLTAGEKCDW
jgi:hypothetical protein